MDTKATVYFRLRNGKKDIKAASELMIYPNHWSPERQGYKDRVALVSGNEKSEFNHKVQELTHLIENELMDIRVMSTANGSPIPPSAKI